MPQPISRRTVLQLFGTSVAAALPGIAQTAPAAPAAHYAFTYCLNMATIRGHKLGLVKELETAAGAGFRAVEIWMDSLQAYLEKGGTLTDLKKRMDDIGIRTEGCIGFAEWIVDDDTRRNRGMEQMKREMGLLAQIGCKRLAAPPVGATETGGLDLNKAAARYRAILELGDAAGVVPQLEMWGFSKNLSRVSEVMYVALESGHASAKVLLDTFHLYKGSTPLDTLSLISPSAIDILHMNDYPAQLTPAAITDADRIYPGDGVAPLKQILQVLRKPATPLILSTEVFNKAYYKQDALTVARTALTKIKAVTRDVS
ncbi:MAG: sugar phosphate isomerase/epimerase [Williamsia sp.]|nr:sugar phosphate isomerase/epimerase [Williamsia sp.]